MRRLELDMRWQAQDDFAKHLRRASMPAEYLLWQVVRNRQRFQAKFRRQHKLGPYVLQWLNQQGIGVIRFTSHEIENDTQRVMFAIDVALKKRIKQDKPPHPPTPSPPRGGEGELEHQLRDVVVAFECSSGVRMDSPIGTKTAQPKAVAIPDF